MPENKTGMSRRRLVECISGRRIQSFKDEPALFDKYVQESREAFKIISNKKHYSIKDVIEMGKRLYEYYGIKNLLIDPYNFFKVEGNGYSHNNDILSQLRVFAESYCSVTVMAHPSSFAPRNNKDEHGYLGAPSKYSIQGGADFPYRVDNRQDCRLPWWSLVCPRPFDQTQTPPQFYQHCTYSISPHIHMGS